MENRFSQLTDEAREQARADVLSMPDTPAPMAARMALDVLQNALDTRGERTLDDDQQTAFLSAYGDTFAEARRYFAPVMSFLLLLPDAAHWQLIPMGWEGFPQMGRIFQAVHDHLQNAGRLFVEEDLPDDTPGLVVDVRWPPKQATITCFLETARPETEVLAVLKQAMQAEGLVIA